MIAPVLLAALALSAQGVETATPRAEALRLIEQMRGLSMQRQALARSDGRVDPIEQKKVDITRNLLLLGDEAITALVTTLSDRDVQMKRNAALVLIALGGGYFPRGQKLDIRAALPALIAATQDDDEHVRAWAAHAIGEIGPNAVQAVPALTTLLTDSYEGCRNNACAALGRIGPAAKEALPALRRLVDDARNDVRRCANHVIARIEGR